MRNMREVKVKKSELLEKVRANRDAHRDLFLKAQEGYRLRIIEELDRSLKDAQEGRRVDLKVLAMPVPEDHTDDYDVVITMLEMEVDDNVIIDDHDIQRFVLDKWDWKVRAMTTNTAYAASIPSH